MLSLWADNAFAVKNIILELLHLYFFPKDRLCKHTWLGFGKRTTLTRFLHFIPYVLPFFKKCDRSVKSGPRRWLKSALIDELREDDCVTFFDSEDGTLSQPTEKLYIVSRQGLFPKFGSASEVTWSARAFISVADNVTSRDFRKRLSRLTLSLLRETHEKRHLKRTITAEHYRAQSNADHVAHYGIAIKIHSPERACLRERNLSLPLRYYTARLYRDAFMYPHSAIYTAEIQIYDL